MARRRPNKYPPVSLPLVENPVAGYYRRDGHDYGILRLIELAKDLPVYQLPLHLMDLSNCIWESKNMMELAAEIYRVNNADLSYPILLDWDGKVADGRHRILKALSHGVPVLPARRLIFKPSPCSTP